MTPKSETTNVAYAIPLYDLTRADVSHAGAKAANLGELAQVGFPVPDGFAMTTHAFDRFVKINALDESQPSEKVAKAELPHDVQEALRAAFIKLNNVPLAVRSSGVAEDLEGASFAGQYETILDVRGYDALVDAVRQCWASAFSERVAAYKANKGQTNHASMAVLIQQLVQAEAAGVAFTANPVNGRRDEAVVSAVRGLGERLVSGAASPDEWIIIGNEATRSNAPENAIDEAQARAIAEMARKAEAHFGSPQDVEWAIADGKLFMLQARPITTLSPEPLVTPIPVPVNPPPGFWERDASHLAEPFSPMARSTIMPAQERATFALSKALSLPMEGAQFREIGGWVYQKIITGGEGKPMPPAWLMPILVRVVPQLRTMIKGMVEAVREDKLWKSANRWYTEWKPNTVAGLDALKKVDMSSLSDEELEQHLSRVLTFVLERIEIHMLVTAADFLVADFVIACQDLLGWDGGKSLKLLSGLSSQTTEPTNRLIELARMVRERPAIRQLFNQVTRETPQRFAEVDGDFAAAYERYMQEFANRTLRWDVNEPTVAEQPELVLRLIRDQINSQYDPQAEAAVLAQERAAVLAEARQILANRSDEARQRFETALARAEHAYPIREDHEFYLANAPLALMRYALLEAGRRMVGRGQMVDAEDIMFLEWEEALSGFRDQKDVKLTVTRRKGELAWVKAHPGPASYGPNPPPPPSFDAFPPEARHLMRVLMWQMENMLAAPDTQSDGSTSLKGLAASAGQYTGPVRIILNETEFDKLQVGDVLVCPTTQPPWSVLFPNIGALVTDSGGILSHPAIIAREYRIPAIVATVNATSLLKDGQIVTVDGDRGKVEIHL